MQLLPVAAEWIPVRVASACRRADTLEGFRCETDREAFFERIDRTADAPRPAAAALAAAVSVRQRVRDARRDVRQADRAHRPVRAGRVPPGVRRRPRPQRRPTTS